MKANTIRRLAAAALTSSILLAAALPVSASRALGSDLVERSTELARGVTLTSRNMWSASKSDLRSEHYITCAPGGGVTPMVYSGAYVTSRSTVSAAAAALERQGYRVIGGVNGGFFNTDGTVVGALMTEGVVRSLDVANYTMVGFTGDGHVFFDESAPVKTAAWRASAESEAQPDVPVLTDYQFPIAGFNAYRSNSDLGGLYLYNRDFNARVNKDPKRDCVAITLTPVSGGEMTMDCSLTFAVAGICDTTAGDAFNGALDGGRYLLYANVYSGNDALLAGLRALRPGDTVTVTVGGASERWSEARYGLSGLYPLLRDGKIVSGLPAGANPYTAIGVKADGTAVLYTIDGRRSGWSVGATYAQVAQRLQELDCVSAAGLDGGGSTTLGATLPGSSSFTVISRPSGGSQRAVNNSILLTAPAGSAILDGGYYPSSGTQVVLAGARLELTAAPYDSTGAPAAAGDPSWAAEGGDLAADGLSAIYTAGTAAGSYPVTTAGGSLTLRVVDTLSSLSVSRQDGGAAASLSVKSGETVDLTASGKWYNLPVAMADENVTWQADAAVGAIDGQGLFTAGKDNASGVITASAGGKTVTIQVTVDNGIPFPDVPGGAWYADAARYAVEHGLIVGTGSGAFAPHANITRGEIMTILARRAGADTSGGSPWYQPGMDWAVARGISDGTSPKKNITREQLITMLYRFADEPAADPAVLDRFPDRGAVSPWAAKAMAWVAETGLVQGTGAGGLNPGGTATRAEAAAILARFCEKFPA